LIDPVIGSGRRRQIGRLIHGPHANPYDNAQAESVMKTPKVEDASVMAYATVADIAINIPRFIAADETRRLHSAQGYRSPAQFKDRNARTPVKTAA